MSDEIVELADEAVIEEVVAIGEGDPLTEPVEESPEVAPEAPVEAVEAPVEEVVA